MPMQLTLPRRTLSRASSSLLLVLLAASAVFAHAMLRSSSPADGEHLATTPRELRLTFTEAPELAVTRVELVASTGERIQLGALRTLPDSATIVIAPIRGLLNGGAYTANWQIAGADGHPVRGSFTFVVAPAGETAPTAGLPGEPVENAPSAHHDPVSMPIAAAGFDAESPAYVVVRFLMYAALLLIVGSVAFRFVVLPLRDRRAGGDTTVTGDAANRAARIGEMASWLLLVACFARLIAQSMALHGRDELLNIDLLRTLVTETSWGKAWLLQLAATILAIAGFRWAGRRADLAAWSTAAVAASILAFTPAFGSHAAASPRFGALAILLDGLHVLGAAGWLGSLTVLLLAGLPAALALEPDRRGGAVADLVNAFSPTALVFAGVVAGTGLFAAWLHIGSFALLFQDTYGRLLLAKLTVLGVVSGTGAYNWLKVRPALGEIEGAARIRKSGGVEVAVAIIVLIITAILVATPTPMDAM